MQSSFLISNNTIQFKKHSTGKNNFCWIGYNIKIPGTYEITFEIYSNTDIINFDFIKLHKPIKFYKVKDILANIWTKINIIIDTFEIDDLLCFIFDNFDSKIELIYKNLDIINLIEIHFMSKR
jgi:hypothetical protein